jgi:hypothetical protein
MFEKEKRKKQIRKTHTNIANLSNKKEEEDRKRNHKSYIIKYKLLF